MEYSIILFRFSKFQRAREKISFKSVESLDARPQKRSLALGLVCQPFCNGREVMADFLVI